MPPRDDRPDVLSNLPHSRPQRRSAKRGAPPGGSAEPRATPAAKRPAAPRRRAAATPPAPAAPRSIEPPSGGEILHSAARAATEIACLGLSVGRETLRAALRRLPRP